MPARDLLKVKHQDTKQTLTTYTLIEYFIVCIRRLSKGTSHGNSGRRVVSGSQFNNDYCRIKTTAILWYTVKCDSRSTRQQYRTALRILIPETLFYSRATCMTTTDQSRT